MVSWSRKTRSLAVAGGAILGGATLFAGGGLLGSSLAGADDDPETNTVYVPAAGGAAPASTNGDAATEAPATPPRTGANTPAPAGESDGGFGGAADSRIAPGYYGGHCPAVLDGVVADGAINPASQGFVMNLLGAGYELQNISLRAEVPCDDLEAEPQLVLDTSWLRTADQRSVWVSQRESAEPTGNILNQGYAEFWSDGYTYSVSSGYIYYAEDGAASEPARDAIFPPPEDDGQSQAVLLEIIGQLAPSLEEQCFFRPVEGDWSALAALGIGDPRSAIPAGFVEDSVWATIFEPPADGCDVARDVELPVSFGASWSDGEGGWISINVYQAGSYYGDPGLQVGYANDWSVNWSDETFQYSVYGNQGEAGLGAATLTAIARAMDGGFDNACLMVDRALSDDELAAAGINAPSAPEGFSLESRRGTVSEPNGNCVDGAPEATYSADWQFSDADGNGVSASAWLDGNTRDVDQGDWYGSIGEGYINWMAGNGVQYSISAWSKTGVSALDRDALIAMALSMDPGLDVNALSEESGGGYPRPLPVEEDSVSEGSGESGSTGE